MKRLAALVIASAASACAALTPRTAPLPLEREGTLAIYAAPLPDAASRLAFEIGSVSAIRADGSAVPLALSFQRFSREEPAAQRLFARARLPPDVYVGLELRIAKGSLAGDEGPVDLLLPEEPVRVDAQFVVARQRATVLGLSLRPGGVEKGFAFRPAFLATAPPKTVTSLVGYCSDGGEHELALFDKRAREVTSLLPTGREPWGVAIDGVRNRAWVALEGADEIEVIDVAASSVLNRIRLSPGDAPRELALTPDRRLLLSANAGSNTVSLIDPSSLFELARVPVGEEPASLLIDRRGARAYSFNTRGNSLTAIDLVTRMPVATVPLEAAPLRGQLNRAGDRLYVASPASPYLAVFSVPDLAVVRRIYVGLGVTALKVDASSDLLYVAQQGEGRLAVYDPFSLVPIDFLDAPGPVAQMAIDDAENALFLLSPESRRLSVLDLATRRELATIEVGAESRFLALTGERQ